MTDPDDLRAEMLDEWELTPSRPAIRTTASVVQRVTDTNGRELALKATRVETDNRGETATLQLWRGQGAAELVRADPRRGVLLLEWLGRPLTEELTPDACTEVAHLFGRLHRPAAPQLASHYAMVAGWLDELDALGREVPAPPRFVEQALSAGRDLIAGAPTHVIHGDLHDGNVLWRDRTHEWVVIDPKGFNGDPCCEPVPMLWNRWEEHEWYANPGESIRERFYELVDASGLDERRCRDWAVVRAMINISWVVGDAQRERRQLDNADRTWITRNVTLAKAMQDVRP